MLDFCYYMQVFTVMLIIFFPKDLSFFKLFFGLAYDLADLLISF